MCLIVLICIRSWKVGTGVAVEEGGKMFFSSNWMGIALSPKPVRPMNLGVLLVRVLPMMEQECAVWTRGFSWLMVTKARVGFSQRILKFAMVESLGLMMFAMELQFWL